MLFGDRRGEIRGEVEPVAWAQPARALGKGAPHTAALVAMQRDLDRGGAALSDQAAGDHLGVVADQQVAGAQQIGQLGNMPVGESAGRWDVQQAGGLARLTRTIRDQLAGQREIEIVEAQRRHARDKGRPGGASIRVSYSHMKIAIIVPIDMHEMV